MYADAEYYYSNGFGDAAESPYDVDKILKQAEIKVDKATFNRIKGVGFASLSPFQQDRIKQVVCYQANHIIENGYDDSSLKSYSVLNVSVTVADSKENRQGLCQEAYDLLIQTGLMSRRL